MKIFISTLIGIIIGYLLSPCGKDELHGPNSNDVKRYIYYDKKSNKYYRYRTEIVICPSYLRS